MSWLRLSCVDAVGDITPSSSPDALEAVKNSRRDALLRVREGKPNTDAEHRIPIKSGSYAQPNFFIAPLRKGESPCQASIGQGYWLATAVAVAYFTHRKPV